MEMSMGTRTVRIHLPDGGGTGYEFRRNIPLNKNIGKWEASVRSKFGFERGRLKCGDEGFDDDQTFADTPNAELQFVGAVMQQPAVAVAPAGMVSLR
jgi:hypothetical protein